MAGSHRILLHLMEKMWDSSLQFAAGGMSKTDREKTFLPHLFVLRMNSFNNELLCELITQQK